MFIIEKVNRNKKNSKINYPIPFNRLINTTIKRQLATGINGSLTDLTPDYIFDKIEQIIKDLYVKDTEQGMIYFHILLRIFKNTRKSDSL